MNLPFSHTELFAISKMGHFFSVFFVNIVPFWIFPSCPWSMPVCPLRFNSGILPSAALPLNCPQGTCYAPPVCFWKKAHTSSSFPELGKGLFDCLFLLLDVVLLENTVLLLNILPEWYIACYLIGVQYKFLYFHKYLESRNLSSLYFETFHARLL